MMSQRASNFLRTFGSLRPRPTSERTTPHVARSRVKAIVCSSRMGLRPFRMALMYQQLSARTGLAVMALGGFGYPRGKGLVVRNGVLVEGVLPLFGGQGDVLGEEGNQLRPAIDLSQSHVDGLGLGLGAGRSHHSLEER